jgi:hypothetical protein
MCAIVSFLDGFDDFDLFSTRLELNSDRAADQSLEVDLRSNLEFAASGPNQVCE